VTRPFHFGSEQAALARIGDVIEFRWFLLQLRAAEIGPEPPAAPSFAWGGARIIAPRRRERYRLPGGFRTQRPQDRAIGRQIPFSPLIMSAVSFAASILTSNAITFAPSRAYVTAAALPLPQPGPEEPAPETIATRFCSRFAIVDSPYVI
jgi:hypothetical protein